MTELVSICIPTYNRVKMLHRAVSSALGQSYKEIEVLISDNASTDTTHAYCVQLASQSHRLRVFRQPRNLGPSGNIEFLAKESRGKYLMILADDDFLEPLAIEYMLRVFQTKQAVVHVGCYYRELYPTDGVRLTHTYEDMVDSNSLLPVSSINNYNKNSRLAVLVYGLTLTEVYRSLPKISLYKVNSQETISGTEIIFLRYLALMGRIGITPYLLVNYTGPGTRNGQDSLAAVFARELSTFDGFYLEMQRWFKLLQLNLNDSASSTFGFSENLLLSRTFLLHMLSRFIFHLSRLFRKILGHVR